MLWIIFAVLTAASVFAVLWPLSRAPAAAEARELDVAFYEAQTAEIDRDVSRGAIGADDAETARTEAARRLIAAGQRAPREIKPSSKPVVVGVALGALVAVPAIALGLYMEIGTPDMPDEPLQARLDAAPANMDTATATGKIEKHLAEQPNDARGWAVLAPIYMRLGRMDDAVTAYTNEIRVLGPSADLYGSLGVAQVSVAGGTVSADARKSFERAVAIDPKSPRGLFYLGLASEQEGDKAKAVDIWRKLVAASPQGAPWLQAVENHIAAATGAPAPAGDAGPKDDVSAKAAAVASMPKDQQQAMIHRMVDGLADRLKTNGNDINGWLRLVRAYQVLNEGSKAKVALSDARRTFAADPAAKKRLDDLAHELGLES